MKLTAIFSITTAVALTACGAGNDEKRKDSMLIVLSQEAVQSKLKDEGSAEFRNIDIHKSAEATVVCGEVNAKNAFGGYAGFQRFVSSGSAELTFLEDQMKPGHMDLAWDRFCRS